MFLVSSLLSLDARAQFPDSWQLGWSRPYLASVNQNARRVWAVRNDLELWSLVHAPPQEGLNYAYAYHGPLPTGAPTSGVSAVSWDSGSSINERAYLRGSNGSLYEYSLINRTSATWTSHTPPTGKTFSGFHVALTGLWKGTRYVTVVFTTTDGTLYSALKKTTDTSFTYQSHGTGFETAAQLAATKTADETTWTFFASKTDGTVQWLRRSPFPLNWSNGNLGSPGVAVCGSMAAAQGQMNSSTYRLHLWCTTRTASETQLRVAYTTSVSSTSFTWTTKSLGGASLKREEFAVTATSRPDPSNPGYFAIDGFAVDAAQHLWRDTYSGAGWPSAVDLGTSDDTSENRPALVAVGTNAGHSYLHWIGRLGFGNYLYSKRALGGTATYPFKTHGSSYFQFTEAWPVDPGVSHPQHTEAMIAEWKGKMFAVAIVRPDYDDGYENDDFAYNQIMVSNDDGQNWSAPVTLPNSVTGALGTTTYEYTTDPTVAVTDSGTAYVVQLGVNYVAECGSDHTDSGVFLTTTTDGTTFTPTKWLRALTGGTDPSLDHPWVAIDRSRTPDRLHFVWAENVPIGRLQYR